MTALEPEKDGALAPGGAAEADPRPAPETTWRGAVPPVLPPLTRAERLRGHLRLLAFATLTVVSVALFVLGRYARAGLGRWVTFHFWIAQQWARMGLALAGLRHDVTGTPVPGGALVANHCSWLDILSLRAVTLMYFVSKAEVADWPGVGFVTRVTGTVFIERRRSQAKAQEGVLRSRIAADQLLIFFPEGTSTDGAQVLPFKSSLFSVFYDSAGAAAPLLVQPVSIRYRPAPELGLPDAFYGWWADMPFYGHIFDVFARSRRGRARIVFHPPVRPADYPNRKALAEDCQRRVAEGHAAL
ncbi:MAG: lysophospholipid acyltransferase family protein [Pseudomonadota bacterium]